MTDIEQIYKAIEGIIGTQIAYLREDTQEIKKQLKDLNGCTRENGAWIKVFKVVIAALILAVLALYGIKIYGINL